MLTALVYGQTLGFGFVYEDLNDTASWLTPWTWAAEHGWGRYLTGMTHGVGYAISGVEPWGHHAVSVSLHLLNGALLWHLLPATALSAWVLGIYLLHPLQIETVAYVSARPDLLLASVTLLAVWAVEQKRVGLALLVAASAVLVKEAGIALVPLVTLWAWSRWRLTPRMGIAACGLAGVGLLFVLAFEPFAWSLTYTGSELAKLAVYAGRFLMPWGLSVEMPWQWISPLVAWFVLLATVLGVIGCLTMPRSPLTWAVLGSLVALSPRLVVPLIEGLHAHHLAVPFVSVALGVGVLYQERETWQA